MCGHFFYPSSIPRRVGEVCIREVSSGADISFIHHRYRDPCASNGLVISTLADISFIHHRYRDSSPPSARILLVRADISFIHHRYRDVAGLKSRQEEKQRTFLLSIIDTATRGIYTNKVDLDLGGHFFYPSSIPRRDLPRTLARHAHAADISFIHHRYRDPIFELPLLKVPILRTFLLSIIDTATRQSRR